ncbi:translation elongation factor Ts [Sutterella sp.]|uniref:translation elongation factor Ts n=1 Tax=Sutterella sp. TaxID=1981025 RepID=UPI0025DC83AD|nr:translation elongation factor Ts [uncultured Sutterella sp.]
MAAISAALVKELRLKTDAPMMECKKALTEADGDMAKAEEILRVKLGNKANKAAARVAAEGVVVVYVSDDHKLGAILEVNSETDFVAKNPEFLKMAHDSVKLVAEKNPATVEELLALPLDGTTVDGVRKALVGKIGENMTFRRFQRIEAKGELSHYVHGSRIGVLVDLVGGNVELAHDIAMHIAASKPKAIDETGIEAALLEAERRIAIEKAREAGKPEAMLERIAEGTVKKFLKEVTLINQPFVKDDKKSINDLLKAAGAKVESYVLYVVGEGIEKKSNDFAAEVAAQAAAAKQA